MKTTEILNQISEYGKVNVNLVSEKDITNGVMVVFSWVDGESVAIAYNDGNIAVLTDWQGSYPTEESEIADYQWVSIND